MEGVTWSLSGPYSHNRKGSSMKLISTLAVAALAAGSTLVGAAPAQADQPRRAGDTSLAEVLAADGVKFDRNGSDFDIVERAVLTVLEAKPDSPVGILAQGNERLTAFVPTDDAFRGLVHDLTGSAPKREKVVFNQVAGVGVDTVETILLYHVVPGATINSRQAAQSDDAKLVTAQGKTVKVNVRRKNIFLVDQDRDDRNPRLVKSLLDINKGNKQIAHGINRVLRPVDL